MRRVPTLMTRELKTYFQSPMAYLLAALFAAVINVMMGHINTEGLSYGQPGQVMAGIMWLSAFLLIFLVNLKNWWALIPAGVLFSLAAMFVLGFQSGGVFLIGLGLTFGILGFVPTEHGRMRWAFIPAAILILVGIFITLASYNLFALFWPLGLIAGGVMIIYFVIKTRK